MTIFQTLNILIRLCVDSTGNVGIFQFCTNVLYGIREISVFLNHVGQKLGMEFLFTTLFGYEIIIAISRVSPFCQFQST